MPCIMPALVVRLVLVKHTTRNAQFPQCCGSWSLPSLVCSTYSESSQLLMGIFSRVYGEPLRFFGGIELFIRHFLVAGALYINWYTQKRNIYTIVSVSRLHDSTRSSPGLGFDSVVSSCSTNRYTTYVKLFFTSEGFLRYLYQVWKAPEPGTAILTTQLVVFFGMTIWKLVESTRSSGKPISQYKLDKNMTPLLIAFVRDGTIFFLLYVLITNSDTHFSLLQRVAGLTSP